MAKESKVPYVTSATVELEVAMVNAATKLTVESVGKVATEFESRYKMFYAAIVDAYNEVH